MFAEWPRADPGAPTVLVYGHHDVQPVDPDELWDVAAVRPASAMASACSPGRGRRQGPGRSTTSRLRGLLARDGRLPVNVKLLVEGEEEVGSPALRGAARHARDRLRCDVVVVSDTGMWWPRTPSICTGMRGLVAFDDRRYARPPTRPALGIFGGAVPNPLHHGVTGSRPSARRRGRVTMPGFYDACRPNSTGEARARSRRCRSTRTSGCATRRAVRSRARRASRRWSASGRGRRPRSSAISGGYTGAGIKTIVPADAHAKVTFRLVADQDRDERHGAGRCVGLAAGRRQGSRSTSVRPAAVAPAPRLTPLGVRRAVQRRSSGCGAPQPLFTREGGSGPEEALGRVLDAPVVFLGVGLPDDRIHAPNERMVMAQF